MKTFGASVALAELRTKFSFTLDNVVARAKAKIQRSVQGARMSTQDPTLFVIFGGTGDLAKRKLFPALNQCAVEGLLHERTRIVGVGRKPIPDEAFRAEIAEWLDKADLTREQQSNLLDRLHYQPIGEYTDDDFRALRKRLEELCKRHDVPPNYGFYLSLPPGIMPRTVAGLGNAGLNKNTGGWTRVVLEKPFGHDLATAQQLNAIVHEHFTENQIYRIDHYLGKDTVQNLLVFRLANGLIESAWNRERVDSVQITVGETLGVGSRAGYYDKSGALRDMVQNHITQLLTLVAMEAPSSFSAEAIRYEKIKVLRQIRPIQMQNVVRGQYTAGTVDGEQARGYLDEENIPKDSDTETFVAFKLFVDSWRWQGVPFYLRTGKRLPKKLTQIAVRFREAPVSFFQQLGCSSGTASVLIVTLQPNEGFSFHFDIKVPGDPFRLQRIPLRFDYQDKYDSMPEAYQTLLLDVLDGVQTLFVHSDEVEESWRLYMPLIENPPKCKPYPCGTWGPMEAQAMSIPEVKLWQAEE